MVLDSHLGIVVNPGDVKLMTKPGDPYAWRILTIDKSALFTKQLSKHSIRAYVDLCNGIGTHFEAVQPERAADHTLLAAHEIPAEECCSQAVDDLSRKETLKAGLTALKELYKMNHQMIANSSLSLNGGTFGVVPRRHEDAYSRTVANLNMKF